MTRKKPVKVVFMVAFLDLFSASMVTTILSSYLRDKVGLSASLSGVIASLYGSVQFFSSPIIGGWSDHKGFRWTLTMSLLICVVGYSFLTSHWWPLLVLSRVISGLFKHTQNLCRTHIAALTSEEEKIRVYGRLNAIGNVGFMFGPALAGWMSARWSYEMVFLTSSSIFATMAIIVWTQLSTENDHSFNDKTGAKENGSVRSKDEPARSSIFSVFQSMQKVNWNTQWDLMIVRLLLSSSVLLYRSNFNWIVTERFQIKSDSIGYLTSFQGAVAFATSYFSGALISMYSKDKVKTFFHITILLAISLCGLIIAKISVLVYAGFLAMLCFGTSIMRVLSLDLTTERCSLSETGLVIGTSASIVSVARALSPAIGGILFDLNPDFSVFAGIIMTVISCFVIRTYSYRNQALWQRKNEKIENADLIE